MVFFDKIVGLLVPQKSAAAYTVQPPPHQPRALQKLEFRAAGVQYYTGNIHKLSVQNPEYRQRSSVIVKAGHAGKRIYRYDYINKPVKLIPEPSNPYDPNAIMILIAGEKVGYISREETHIVSDILINREIKYVSSFISGGKYKVISDDGEIETVDSGFSVYIRIGFV